jgi:hypothetical protein
VVKEADSRPAAQAHGFESHSSYTVWFFCKKTLVEEGRRCLNPKIALAQSVERRPFKPNVAGSSPACGKELVVSFKITIFNV